jgi:hypothetical protein
LSNRLIIFVYHVQVELVMSLQTSSVVNWNVPVVLLDFVTLSFVSI